MIKRRPLFAVAAIVLLAISLTISNTGEAFAISLDSKYPAPSETVDNQTGAAHVARGFALYSTHGVTLENYFKIYYDSDPGTGKTITYNQSACNIDDNGAALKTWTGHYSFDNGAADYNDHTYKNSGGEGKACVDRDFRTVGAKRIPSIDKWVVGFKVILDPSGIPAGTDNTKTSFTITAPGGLVAAAANPGNDDVQTNGLNFGAAPGTDSNFYVKTNIPFGQACTKPAKWGTVTVYDADNTATGATSPNTKQIAVKVKFRIYKDGQPLDGSFDNADANEKKKKSNQNKYYGVTNATIVDDGAGDYIQPIDGSGVSSSVQVKLQPGHRYVLKIWNVYQSPASASPDLSNYVGFNAPGDGAYGADNILCGDWTVTPGSDVVEDEVPAGSAANFTHTITNYEDDSSMTTDPIRGKVNASLDGVPVTPTGTSTAGPRALGLEEVMTLNRAVPLPAADLTRDHVYCENITATPRSRSNSGPITSDPAACVTYYWWDQKPTISLGISGIVESGATIPITATITNDGSRPSPADSTWHIERILYNGPEPAKGGSSSIDTDAPGNSCEEYWSTPDCVTLSSNPEGNNSVGNGFSSRKVININDRIEDDMPIGSRVCYVLYVNETNVQDDKDAVSNRTNCLVVGKKPKAHITGGDLVAGTPFVGTEPVDSKVVTSVTRKSIDLGGTPTLLTFGSWTEYGLISVGPVTGTGSGAAYANSDGHPGLADATATCKASPLTITNESVENCTGPAPIDNYTNMGSLPDLMGYFTSSPCVKASPTSQCTKIATSTVVDSLQTGVYKDTDATSVIMPGGTVGANKWHVLYAPSATVYITGNIEYDNGPYTSIAQIPQLVIIAKNIKIASAVTQVDSWLIASNMINTCAEAGTVGGLSASICKGDDPTSDSGDPGTALTVNGPTMSKSLYLRRTAGAMAGIDGSGDPAEVFNLRPDAYIWANVRALSVNSAQTAITREVPARF